MKRLAKHTAVGAYRVQRFMKKGYCSDSYVVRNAGEQHFFMKRFDLSAVPEQLKTQEAVLEILACRQIGHPQVVAHVADGDLTVGEITYPYLIMPFYEGTLLSEELRVGHTYTPAEALDIIVPVLEGLQALHEVDLCHNNLTPDNILLEPQGNGKVVPKIIGLGHICNPVLSGTPPFPVRDLNPLYMAPEALRGIFTEENDTFAVTAIMYSMLSGRAPWEVEFSEDADYATRKKLVQAARRQKLQMPAGLEESNPKLQDALLVGLAPRLERSSVTNLLRILKGLLGNAPVKSQKKNDMMVNVEIKKHTQGGGFADVAGMDALKKTLAERVIWILSDKEKAAKYRLTPPNGMLLYGPPGCGKTHFAQKFAEESHFNYVLVTGSDLGSTYIHGTQGKIANLFKEAQAKAPTVICFDEFDAFVPKRGSREAEHKSEEVNEFLTQLNNCAQRGIFVIGTTNRIDILDPAVLRKGRFDLQYEVPAPDLETRASMFRLHLERRPLGKDIDTVRLAAMTDGYAAADIAFIVNEAAVKAALADEAITQKHLEEVVSYTKPSLPRPMKAQRRPIGY